MKRVLIQDSIGFLFLLIGLFCIGFSSPVLASETGDNPTVATEESSQDSVIVRIFKRMIAIFRNLASGFQKKADEDEKKAQNYEKSAEAYQGLADAYRQEGGTDSEEAAGWFQKIADGFRRMVAWFRGKSQENQKKADLYESIADRYAGSIAPSIDEQMAQCKLRAEQFRIQRNKQLLQDMGVNSNDIKCYSHTLHDATCTPEGEDWSCRPNANSKVKNWYTERAGGVCYDRNAANPPASQTSLGPNPHARNPTTEAQKTAAVNACKTNVARLKEQISAPDMDRKMAQCKLTVEQLRKKRNIQLLLSSGVSPQNMRCHSHNGVCMTAATGRVCRPSAYSTVQSWYVERAGGVCYESTAPNPPDKSESMGSEGRTPPTTTAGKEAALEACEASRGILEKEVSYDGTSQMDREMAQCKIRAEQLRIEKNTKALAEAGVSPQNIKCFSHDKTCMATADGEVCRPVAVANAHIQSWYVEKAEGLCYDTTANQQPSLSDSMGSDGQNPPTTVAEKKTHLTACRTHVASLEEELGVSPMDRQMMQCKLEIELVRAAINRELLESAGVSAENIECYYHPKDNSQVQSWYIERAQGRCYDKTAATKPSLSDSIGSEGRTPPETKEEKAAALKACQTNLALSKRYLEVPSMDKQMAQCKVEVEQLRIKRNRQLLESAGVSAENIECYSHTFNCMTAASGRVCRPGFLSNEVEFGSWYIERAAGICYDKTMADAKPPISTSMGSAGRTPPETEAQKLAYLTACRTSLARLQEEATRTAASSSHSE